MTPSCSRASMARFTHHMQDVAASLRNQYSHGPLLPFQFDGSMASNPQDKVLSSWHPMGGPPDRAGHRNKKCKKLKFQVYAPPMLNTAPEIEWSTINAHVAIQIF